MKTRASVSFCTAASLLLALFLCLAGCGSEAVYYPAEPGGEFSASSLEEGEEPEAQPVPPEPEMPVTIWVYVCGAVHDPGVYELPAGSRVFAALEAAGGLTGEADERSLNQAAALTDGEQITVYTKEETADRGVLFGEGDPASGAAEGSGRINLNTAGKEELMTLAGIGETRAAAILAYRELHGPFSSIEEIMNVDGIKEKSFEKIKEYIEV